ncbi:FHF complex subunit HOOK-interacting protein 2B isoform 2-T6 [Vipera latastei]
MALLGRLGDLLRRAVEAEEPRLDLPAAFTEHWKGVTHHYLEAADENKSAKQTDIPWRLKQMLDILVYEEKQQLEGETGPCLEYLLQHKVLETLSTLGKAEYPPGMRSQVLLFFSCLLGQMQSPLLHYFNVYRPVQKLLQLQGDALGPNPEPEKEVLQFVGVLCTKIRQEPALLPYVLEGQNVASLGLAAKPSMTSGQAPPSSEEQGGGLCPEKPLGDPAASMLNLVTALIGLCKSKNKKVVLKAQENLLLLTSVDHPTAAQALAQDSMLCLLLSDYLCSLYNAIPVTIKPADVTVPCRLHNEASVEESSFPGKHSLEAFLDWLDFCDRLVKQAHPVVGDALSTTVGRRLFLETLQPQLLEMSDSGILFSVAILTGLARRIHAPALLRQLAGFLLGAEMDPARPSNSAWRPQSSSLCSRLIENCSHPSDEISIATLQLFEELLWLPDQRILQSLVLCHLEERSYVLRSPLGQEDLAVPEQEFCEEGLDLEEDPYFADGLPAAEPQRPSQPATLVPKEGPGQPAGPVDVKEAVSSFLCLVPSEVKTSPYLEEAGYDTYVHDAKVLFQECCANVACWTWPQTQLPQKSNPAGPRFYEGPFLQPYAVNLQVTSVLSRLALFPHPHLHEYLLDPYLPLAPGCRTLFSVLIRVISSLVHKAHRITDFSTNVLLVRKKLMGLVPDDPPIGHQMFLEGVIVLEEFCKELAAIVFVKSALKGPLGQSQQCAPSPS